MLKYFSKIALRYLWRNKTYSLLNYACLTFGFLCAVMAVMYILNVVTHDEFHKNYKQLYSVEAYVTYFNGDRFPKEYLSASLPDLLAGVPEISKITRITGNNSSFINEDKTFTADGLYADNNFFEVFTFPLIRGNGTNVLKDPNSVAISEPLAMKFFESTDCVGKTLIIKDGDVQEALKISGVFKNVPHQSMMQFDFVISFSHFLAENPWATEMGATSNETWIVLENNANYHLVNLKIKDLIKNQEANLNQELFLFPLKEKILYSYAGGIRIWREMNTVVIVGAIALVILLIACFNFINLSVAINIRRYREAGIKKVVGSRPVLIVNQFLGETFFLILISLLSSIMLLGLLLPAFNTQFEYDIQLQLLNLLSISIIIAIAVLTGIISGIFPALYLAKSRPATVLKGKPVTTRSHSVFRQSMIIFQFTIPVALVICMMIIKVQDNYMRNYNVGVDKDKLIVLENLNTGGHAESIKSDLLAIHGIDAVSYTNCIPSRGAQISNDVSWEGKESTEKLHFWCINSDFDYNKTVTLQMAEGRFFNPEFPSDSGTYIINDVAAREMKNDHPLGSSITVEGKKGIIIGVVKDFHAIDLAGPLVPIIFRLRSTESPAVLVKFSSGDYSDINNNIQKTYARYFPDTTFTSSLFGDLPSYSNLRLPSQLTGLAFIIALLLACMGLFGLASFTSESRIKEIGIRKANGATTFSIVRLFLGSYVRWLVISFFIGLPIAFILGKMFLSRFYFHTPIPVWTFIAGPAIALTVALSTVGLQTWTVAQRNPVDALRYE